FIYQIGALIPGFGFTAGLGWSRPTPLPGSVPYEMAVEAFRLVVLVPVAAYVTLALTARNKVSAPPLLEFAGPVEEAVVTSMARRAKLTTSTGFTKVFADAAAELARTAAPGEERWTPDRVRLALGLEQSARAVDPVSIVET